MNLLLTGGCGFIGHHFVQYMLQKYDNCQIIVIDKLTYASKGAQRLCEINAFDKNRCVLLTWDLATPLSEGMQKELAGITHIVHMAAETHVDRSISSPVECIQNNIMSTVHLLEFAKTLKNLQKFIYFSTDEVYGPANNDKLFSENDRHNPTNPYSASKSASENIAMSYKNTWNLPVIVVNVMNVYGERQHVEKFIPLCIRKILLGEPITIHCYPGTQQPGSRFYVHAKIVASAVDFLLSNGAIGEHYSITGEKEVSNLDLAAYIGYIIGKQPNIQYTDCHDARPGHDVRYGLDGKKLLELGFKVQDDFEKNIIEVVKWTLINSQWLQE